MTKDKADNSLDLEAEALFRDLMGMDDSPEDAGASAPGLEEALFEQERRDDPVRVLVAQAIAALARVLDAARRVDFQAAGQATQELIPKLQKLCNHPHTDGRLRLRYRGHPLELEGEILRDADFEVEWSGVLLDLPHAADATQRLAQAPRDAQTVPDAEDLLKNTLQAFKLFSENQVNSLYLSLGNFSHAREALLRKSLRFLSAYQAVALGGADARKIQSLDPESMIVMDETRKPDLNLSLLAALNSLKPETVAQLVSKIRKMMLSAHPGDPMEKFTGAYDAVFGFSKLREKLKKPPIEINNLRWLVARAKDRALSPDKARMARMVSMVFGKSSPRTGRMLDTLYARDYGKIDAVALAERMVLATELLEAVDRVLPKPARPQTTASILQSLEDRLGLVHDEVYDELVVNGTILKARNAPAKGPVKACDQRILGLVEFFQQRSLTKEKVKSLLGRSTSFDAEDYAVISRDFGVTMDEARKLAELLAGCFDFKGRFRRGAFEKNVHDFAAFDDKVFEFLWFYLKEIMDRQDRIAYLNALQLLIDQMKNPAAALDVLMSDFHQDPETVAFSDRNALMLASLLLRTYNKELHTDIEFTPEEVLLVVEGLNPDCVDCIADILTINRERFIRKLRIIHKKLNLALQGKAEPGDPPLRYLITLEREVFILLSLKGGPFAHSVIKSAIAEYAAPETSLYTGPNSPAHLPALVGLFQVLIRGLSRFGKTSDLNFLRGLSDRRHGFLQLSRDSRHADQVNRVLSWADRCVEQIGKSRFME